MSRTLSVPIGTTTFHILKFDASTQLKLLGDLQKEILPAAGSLFGAVVGGQANEGSPGAGEATPRDEQAVMQALRHLSSRLGGDELQKWFGLLVGPDGRARFQSEWLKRVFCPRNWPTTNAPPAVFIATPARPGPASSA